MGVLRSVPWLPIFSLIVPMTTGWPLLMICVMLFILCISTIPTCHLLYIATSLDLVGCESLQVGDARLESLNALLLSVWLLLHLLLLWCDGSGTLPLHGGLILGLVVHGIVEV